MGRNTIPSYFRNKSESYSLSTLQINKVKEIAKEYSKTKSDIIGELINKFLIRDEAYCVMMREESSAKARYWEDERLKKIAKRQIKAQIRVDRFTKVYEGDNIEM